MAPRKLSEADKRAVIEAYRQSGETTATLAGRYGVSNSTISRILKQSLPEEEYEALVQQRRLGAKAEDVSETEEAPQSVAPVMAPTLDSTPTRRQRKRSTPSQTAVESPLPEPQMSQLELEAAVTSLVNEPPVEKFDSVTKPILLAKDRVQNEIAQSTAVPGELKSVAAETSSSAYAGLVDEDLEEALDDLDEDDLDDDLEDDLDDDLDDEADGEPIDGFSAVQIVKGKSLQVLPLSEAQIPRTCYVVVDRASELITRPLKDFAELGQIPDAEIQEKTLPIFDNHRIAKRFLRRMQRVVKVPDGRVFQKVRPYLQAKGITRLLIDGQIYSL